MAKKKGHKPRREVTKHQLARWQQQRKRHRIILGLGILVIIAALGILGVGWYVSFYQPMRQTVITVNDTEFDMNYYIKMLKLYGKGQPSSYIQFLAGDLVAVIQRNELVQQGAINLNITVSDDAVDQALKDYEPPLIQDRDSVRADLLIRKLQDEYFEQQVPVFAEQRHILAMFLESESQVNEVRTRLESGAGFAELAGELSLDIFSKIGEGDLGWRPREVLTELLGTSIPVEYAFGAGVGVLSEPVYDETKIKPVGYWLIHVSDRKEDLSEAQVQAILLPSQEKVQSVRARLEAGGSFGALAEEFSQHDESKESGGDLDWISPDMMSSAFDEFAFNPEVEPGTLSEPIRDDMVVTSGGYWLLKVVDVDDNREIADEDRDLLKDKLLTEWFDRLWTDNKVEVLLDDDMKAWAVEQAVRS